MSYFVHIIEIKSIFCTNIIVFLTSNGALLTSNIVFLISNGALLTSNIVFLTRNEALLTSNIDFLISNGALLIRNIVFLTSNGALLISNNIFCIKKIRFCIQQGLSIQYNSSMHYTFFSCFTGTSTFAISVGATPPENILA